MFNRYHTSQDDRWIPIAIGHFNDSVDLKTTEKKIYLPTTNVLGISKENSFELDGMKYSL